MHPFNVRTKRLHTKLPHETNIAHKTSQHGSGAPRQHVSGARAGGREGGRASGAPFQRAHKEIAHKTATRNKQCIQNQSTWKRCAQSTCKRCTQSTCKRCTLSTCARDCSHTNKTGNNFNKQRQRDEHTHRRQQMWRLPQSRKQKHNNLGEATKNVVLAKQIRKHRYNLSGS